MIAMTRSERNCVSSCSCGIENSAGPTRRTAAPSTIRPRPSPTVQSGFAVHMPGASGAWKQALRPDDEKGQKHQMSRQNLPGRIDLRAEGLSDAEDDAAGQRSPETAETAEDDRLEGGNEPAR